MPSLSHDAGFHPSADQISAEGSNAITDQEVTVMNGYGMGLGMDLGWLRMIITPVIAGRAMRPGSNIARFPCCLPLLTM